MFKFNLFTLVSDLVNFFTFHMDSGGGGATTSTNYTTNTNLPAYAQPYYEQLMKSVGQSVYTTDAQGNVTGVQAYSPYTSTTALDNGQGGTTNSTAGQLVANLNPTQTNAINAAGNLTLPSQYAAATSGLQAGQNMGLNAAGIGFNQALGYTPSTISNQNVYSGNLAQGASQFMNPYVQQALMPQLQYQQQLYGEQNAGNAAQGIGQGVFSGSREALMQAQNQQNQNMNLANVYGQGMNQAYNNAMQTAGQQNAQNIQAQTANQQANLTAQQATQQGQQYAANLGLQMGQAGLGAANQASAGLGTLGTQQAATNLSNIQAQTAAGNQLQQQQQNQINNAYQQYMNQVNYPKQQLQYLSGIMQGQAGALGSSQVQYLPAPTATQQMASLGLAGIGLSKALGS